MPDRVPSDHPSVDTVEATVERVGRTDRPRISIPDDAADSMGVEPGAVVRVVLDGSRRFARLQRPVTGDGLVLPGAYETPDAARDPGGNDTAGDNRLPAWCEAAGLSPGRSVLVDVVEPGYLYGLRAPGERAVYEATGSPDSGLADIAESVTDCEE